MLLWLIVIGQSGDSVFCISCILLNGLVFKESSRMNKCSSVFLHLSASNVFDKSPLRT